jgi:DnaJ-class molecular chaperone
MSEEGIRDALLELGLIAPITKEELKGSYKEQARRYHPDLGGDVEKFARIKQAYELLLEYIESFRYFLSEDEIAKQDAHLQYKKQFGGR